MPRFEECLQRLEAIVKEMERGDLPLEQSLKLFEEGIALSNACRKELDEAEGKIEVLLKQDGKLQTAPFPPTPTKGAPGTPGTGESSDNQ